MKENQRDSKASMDISTITRFLPSDLKYGAMKNYTLSAHLRAKENEKQLLRSGSLQGHQFKKIDPLLLMREKKQLQISSSRTDMLKPERTSARRIPILRAQSDASIQSFKRVAASAGTVFPQSQELDCNGSKAIVSS